MKVKGLFTFVALTICAGAANALPLVGMYQTIDDSTNQPKAIVALYEYAKDSDAKLAGRIVATYNPDGTIKDIWSAKNTEPKESSFVGKDIIWEMVWDSDDNQYAGGKITDPQNGKVYSSVIWQDKTSKLNVRGKIGPFGRTQVWNVLDTENVPTELKNLDTANWKPQIKK